MVIKSNQISQREKGRQLVTYIRRGYRATTPGREDNEIESGPQPVRGEEWQKKIPRSVLLTQKIKSQTLDALSIPARPWRTTLAFRGLRKRLSATPPGTVYLATLPLRGCKNQNLAPGRKMSRQMSTASPSIAGLRLRAHVTCEPPRSESLYARIW